MEALSASSIEEMKSILDELNNDMFEEEEEEKEDYSSLCEGINFDMELSEGENISQKNPILTPFTSYEKKNEDTQELQDIDMDIVNGANNLTGTEMDLGYMDDGIFNMLFEGYDVDNLSFKDLTNILETSKETVTKEKTEGELKLMNNEEMQEFIESLFNNESGEQENDSTSNPESKEVGKRYL